jgi:transcription initiation factor TFIIB
MYIYSYMIDVDAIFREYEETYENESENESETSCTNCKSESLFTDITNGIIVCKQCGTVNTDCIIDDGAEWINNYEENGAGNDPSRVGCPINPLLENCSMSTMIGNGGGNKYWLMRKIHQQNAMSYVERSLWHIFEKINAYCENGSLPSMVSNQAKQYYKTLSTKKLSRGGVRRGLIACCIFYSCKEYNITRTIKEIAQMCNTEPTKVTSACKIFEEIMRDHLNKDEVSVYSDMVFRYCSYLGIGNLEQCQINNEVSKLKEVIDRKKILVGKTPSAVISAAIFFILEKKKYSINKRKYSENHNISIVTLNKLKGIIEKNIDLQQENLLY